MQQILSQKAMHWSYLNRQFAVTKRALDCVLHQDRWEYVSRKNPDGTPSGVFDVSKYGARDLKDGGDIMNRWQAAVKRCVNTGMVGKNDHPSNAIVLDYDTTTNDYLVMGCPPNTMTWDATRLFLSLPHRACSELCRASP